MDRIPAPVTALLSINEKTKGIDIMKKMLVERCKHGFVCVSRKVPILFFMLCVSAGFSCVGKGGGCENNACVGDEVKLPLFFEFYDLVEERCRNLVCDNDTTMKNIEHKFSHVVMEGMQCVWRSYSGGMPPEAIDESDQLKLSKWEQEGIESGDSKKMINYIYFELPICLSDDVDGKKLVGVVFVCKGLDVIDSLMIPTRREIEEEIVCSVVFGEGTACFRRVREKEKGLQRCNLQGVYGTVCVVDDVPGEWVPGKYWKIENIFTEEELRTFSSEN